jgi:hypothetical protein
MILMRLIHIEKRLERLMALRPKRRRSSAKKIKLRKRKANRS